MKTFESNTNRNTYYFYKGESMLQHKKQNDTHLYLMWGLYLQKLSLYLLSSSQIYLTILCVLIYRVVICTSMSTVQQNDTCFLFFIGCMYVNISIISITCVFKSFFITFCK